MELYMDRYHKRALSLLQTAHEISDLGYACCVLPREAMSAIYDYSDEELAPYVPEVYFADLVDYNLAVQVRLTKYVRGYQLATLVSK